MSSVRKTGVSKTVGSIRVGTSGWHYKHWTGTFYPAGLSQKGQFEAYKEVFDTVELNNPFYRLPTRDTFKKWKEAVSKDFLYAVKVHRYITHMKKLHDTREPVKLFMSRATALGKKLGPLLFQLPPGWKLNLDRFKEFLTTLPRSKRFVFEFRNPTWYNEAVYELLRKKGCAMCLYELAGHQSPIEITADFVYVRLHGPGDKYQGSYTDETLSTWAAKCRIWADDGLDVFVYFDNDQAGYAAFNAMTLNKMINNRG